MAEGHMEEAFTMEEGRRMPFPSEDELIASFQYLNAGPPYRAPPVFHMHLLPEVVGFIQAGREFLCTDVFSERFRDQICVSIPPPPGSSDDDEQPTVSHYVERKKIPMSTEIPTWQREWRRRILARRYMVSLDRLKYYIAKHKDHILSDMCEEEADRRYAIRKSKKSADVPETVERPTSVKWHFFEMTRSTSPEPTLRVTYEDDPSFVPDDEPMEKTLERFSQPMRELFLKRQHSEESLLKLLSERWRCDVQQVLEGKMMPDGLRPDLEASPEVSISPNTGIPPNELLTLEEQAQKIFTENRNNDQYRRDNEIFSYKKSLMRKFVEGREAERQEVDEPSSDSPDSSSSSSSSEPGEELRIAGEKRDKERYERLVEDQNRHIKDLEEILHILYWRYSEHPNLPASVKSVVDIIEGEKDLLKSFQADR